MRKDVGRLRSSGLETRVGNEVKLEKIWCDVFNIHQGVTHDLDSLASVTNEELNLKRGKLILRLNNLDDRFKIFKFRRKFNRSSCD